MAAMAIAVVSILAACLVIVGLELGNQWAGPFWLVGISYITLGISLTTGVVAFTSSKTS